MGEDLHKRVENDFIHHPPTSEAQIAKYAEVRKECLALAHKLIDLVGNSRELSSALSRLEEVMFHTNAGIARRG